MDSSPFAAILWSTCSVVSIALTNYSRRTITTAGAIENKSKDDLLYSDVSSSKQIRRNDSEFSLGLSRCDSVNINLNEIGPLCSSAQIFLFWAKKSILVVASSCVIFLIIKRYRA